VLGLDASSPAQLRSASMSITLGYFLTRPRRAYFKKTIRNYIVSNFMSNRRRSAWSTAEFIFQVFQIDLGWKELLADF
jgi:hypothetical protein